MKTAVLFLVLAAQVCLLWAQPKNLSALVDQIEPELVAWRRHIHQNPELSNREFKTAEMVASHLKALGMEVRTNIGFTGVVGVLRGGKKGPVIALRADMDALPVDERVDLPFRSTALAEYNGAQVPVMHACGHDAHVAVLMATASVLTKLKNQVPGTILFVFQPAEEGPPAGEKGGAPLMMEEGVFSDPKPEAIFGLHINSALEAGMLGYKKGSAMASSDWFTVEVMGKQVHGSQPWAGIDPIVAGAQIIQGFQTIVSRQSKLTTGPVVITVGRINAGVRENIIPEKLTMSGTIRTLDEQMRLRVHEHMRTTAENIARASGATAHLIIENKTLVTYNDPALVDRMVPHLGKAAPGRLKEVEWTTGAEDFSFFTQNMPGFYFLLGGRSAAIDEESAPAHHTPYFQIDDSGLTTGVRAFCHLVFGYSTK